MLDTVEGGAGAHSGSVEIGGQLGTFTATGLTRAGIRVAHNIGLLRISGDVSDSTITARGTVVPGVTDVAIGAVQVIGNVSNTSIRAGYDILDAPVNAHAQIGAVGVTGNWTASVLAAGVVPGPDGLFGNADDRLVDGAGTGHIISKIARVLIRGIVEGTPGAGDHFGFVAQQIGSFSSNGALPRAAVGGQSFELGTNSDTTVRAVPLVF